MTARSPGSFDSASTMLGHLRRGRISSRELLEALIVRLRRYDKVLNSVVIRDYRRARRDADAADARRARGQELPLLGLPTTIKESIDVAGLASTAGVDWRIGHRAERDAPTVQRLRNAGAVILGKTNVCTWLSDFTADNPVYGRTCNPWDLARTCGGSSGGSAPLAAGLTMLDLGSDMGGSIRVPPAFCGLWGHRPSDGMVPNRGHFPGSDHPNTATTLAAQGPLARSARDLELALTVLAGPDAGMETGWRLALPPARGRALRDFRVAILEPPPWLAVDEQIVERLHEVADVLRRAGATVVTAQPAGMDDWRHYYGIFRSMMATIVSSKWKPEQKQAACAGKLARGEEFHAADARGIAATAGDYLQWHEQREHYRAAWRDFFQTHDVLLTPMTLTPAFEHTSVPTADRRLKINGADVEFDYMSFFPGVSTLVGHPATAFPAGRTRECLPIGLQAIGPLLEDRTPIRLAAALEREWHGFEPPGGYDGHLS